MTRYSIDILVVIPHLILWFFSQAVFLEDLSEGSTLFPTLGGEFVTLTKEGSNVTVASSLGEAKVVQADIVALNGVLHLLDSVL